jgi:hypothetical protein
MLVAFATDGLEETELDVTGRDIAPCVVCDVAAADDAVAMVTVAVTATWAGGKPPAVTIGKDVITDVGVMSTEPLGGSCDLAPYSMYSLR